MQRKINCKNKKAATKKPPKSKSAAALLGLRELVRRGKDALKPTPKKLNKKQKAQKIKDDKAKVKADKAAQKKKDALRGTPGAVDRAIISGGKAASGWRRKRTRCARKRHEG